MSAEHPGVRALRQARVQAKAVEEDALNRLSTMPIPAGCALSLHRCKTCKVVGGWLYLADHPEIGCFYDPCRCLLDMTLGKPGKGAIHLAHLP